MREWLKKIREEKEFSQIEIAKKAQISYPHYNFIENGKRRPSPRVARRIADILGFADEWYRLLV